MTFATLETSRTDGQPIELYEFVGTFSTWRLTSYQSTVTAAGGTFIPLAGLERGVLKVGTQEEDSLALDITLPFDHPMVSAYAYMTAPPQLDFTLYRVHLGDLASPVTMWKGKVTAFSVEGRKAKFRVPSLFSYMLGGVAPQPRFQAPCNHVLYDVRCSISAAANSHTTTVTAIADRLISVASNPYLAGDCNAGELVFAGGNQSRMIMGNTGLDFTVTYPFAGLTIGASVTLRRGCDHSFETCKTKFSNGINYGGTPLVPDHNPFSSKIR
jgi:uncharacterized phage protein (TIGR02218 family)